jgi:hypothetical protein
MVLIVLIVLWGIVLIPPAWQSHAEARKARQVDAFRRKLSVLAPAADTPLARRPLDAARPFEAARAHVAVVAPRNVVRLPIAAAQAVEYAFLSGDTPGPPGLSGDTPGPPGLSGNTPGPRGLWGNPPGPGGAGLVAAAAAEAAARRAERARARVDVLRRRQQVLVGLMAATVVSAAAALLLGDVRLWAAHGLVVVAFSGYLSGLRRLKRLAVERRAKVRYLPAAPAGEGQGEARRAAATR